MTAPLLTVERVSKRLAGREILREVSLTWPGAGTLRLAGRNGRGKSTLLRCVAGVLRPDAGEIAVGGRSILRDARAKRSIGYLPDVFAPFPALTVFEMLRLVAALKRCRPPTAGEQQRFGVTSFLFHPMSVLSAGQQRRAALLAALIGAPPLLLLDEPTNGLDADGVALLGEVLAERAAAGQAALLVTHDAGFAASVAAAQVELDDGALAIALPGVAAGARASR
jgi:ABC-type multidrug transport system ATPase subunit